MVRYGGSVLPLQKSEDVTKCVLHLIPVRILAILSLQGIVFTHT